MNFFRGRKILTFGFLTVSFLFLFNFLIDTSFGQTAYYTATQGAPDTSNVGGTVGSEASCNPAKNTRILKNKADGLAAASGFAKGFGVTDQGLEADSNQANNDVTRNDELAQNKADKFSENDTDDATDLAIKACEENLKSSKKYSDEKKKAEKKCFEGKAGQAAKAEAEKAAREKADGASCAEGEDAKIICSVAATPKFGSTSGACKKKGDNVRCSVSNFSCGVSCTKTCIPKKGAPQKSSSNRYAPVLKAPKRQAVSGSDNKFSVITSSGQKFIFTPPSNGQLFFSVFNESVDVVETPSVREAATVPAAGAGRKTGVDLGIQIVDKAPPTIPVTTAPRSGEELIGGQTITTGASDRRVPSIQSGGGGIQGLFNPFGGGGGLRF